MNDDTLAQLTLQLRDFAQAREWEQFHIPKNLAMAITAEAGELAAEFQWMTAKESLNPSAEALARIKDEAADVALYLIRLADTLNFDLVEAAKNKVDVNEKRYPAEKVRGSAKKYDEY